MLKDPDSIYIPKERGANWVKLKGDYVDGLTDTLDLIILGGYFGDSAARYGPSKHWSDQITSFLIGVIDRIDPLNSMIAYAIPFAKVGTGFSMDELNQLRTRLRDNLSKNEGKFKPSYLECKWKPSLQDRPDCWITNLSRSIILEVKAAEMIVSESYPTGHTLRFPRVVKIRYDKDWN
jgi:DNA ligase-4